MTPAKISELMSMMNDNGLVFSALCGDLGHGFGNKELNPGLIEKSKRILELAKELGTDVVTTHIGVVPTDPNHDRYKIMQEACHTLAEYADSLNAHFAIETGPETADVLYGFIQDTEGGVGVNLDPANFVMVTGQDPVAAVKLLGKHIVHTHVKDGVMLRRTDPKIIYDHFATGGIEALNVADFFKEVPVGTGDVDFPAYIAALKAVGYDGYLTIERETGADPEADIVLARDTIKKLAF
jgi:sugar phosphate isomerase/epimerase